MEYGYSAEGKTIKLAIAFCFAKSKTVVATKLKTRKEHFPYGL